MLRFYPYLRGPFNYDCADDPWEAGKAPYSPGHDADGDQYKTDERSAHPLSPNGFVIYLYLYPYLARTSDGLIRMQVAAAA